MNRMLAVFLAMFMAAGLLIGFECGMFFGLWTAGSQPHVHPTYIVQAPPKPGVGNPNDDPDWTVVPCVWWADQQNPVLPPFTIDNACVDASGNLQWIDASGNVYTQLPTK